MSVFVCAMCKTERDAQFHGHHVNEWGSGYVCNDCHIEQMVSICAPKVTVHGDIDKRPVDTDTERERRTQ